MKHNFTRTIPLTLLLIITLFGMSACNTTGSPWGGSDTQAQQPPSVLTEGTLVVDGEGTTYDPYDYYVAQRQTRDAKGQTVYDPNLKQIGSDPYNSNNAQTPYQGQDIDEFSRTVNDAAGQNSPYGNTQGATVNGGVLPPAQKVKVAILLPLSGQHKSIGQEMLNAAQMALFDVGDLGFELLPKDTKGTEDGSLRAASQAISEGAAIILGPLFAGNAKAIRPMIANSGIYNIAFSTDWTVAGDHTLTMGILPFAQVKRITDYMTAQGSRNFAMITPRTDYGEIVQTTLMRELRSNGLYLKESNIMQFDPLESDLSNKLRDFTNFDGRKLKHEKELAVVTETLKKYPSDRNALNRKAELSLSNTAGEPPFDTIMVPIGGKEASTIVNLLRFYDIDGRHSTVIGTGLWDDPGLISEQAFNGTIFASPSPQARNGFEKNYHSLYGKRPARIASLAYDATALAAVLSHPNNRRAGQNVFSREALFNPNGFAGVDGIFRFRSNGLVERGLAVLEIQDGSLVVKDPAPVTFEGP